MTTTVPPARPEPLEQQAHALENMTELYRQHLPGALRLAHLLTGDSSLAQDIAQDAFLQAAARRFLLRSPSAFPGYLRKTVVRCVLMQSRGVSRERQRALRVDSCLQPLDHGDFSRTSDLIVDLERALAALPPRQRAAIVLRYWLDLSEREISILLRCRPGTVKSSISRGLALLRKDFDV